MKFNIKSEYEKLRTAIVHEPGNEIERLTPSNVKRLLFDDVPYLEEMKREHREFVKVLKQNGATPLEVRDLLTEVLKDEEIRRRLVAECMELDKCGGMKHEEFLNSLEPEEVAEILFAGMTDNEWKGKKTGEKTENETGEKSNEKTENGEEFFVNPIPNSYFTRDPSAIIGSGVVSCKMCYPVRTREAIIMKYIFKFHPLFRGNSTFWYGEKEEEDRPYTIEGGDIVVLDSDTVAVGNSERTKSYSIEKLAQNLFNYDVVDVVYEVKIPIKRIYMHLDTVFSVVSENTVIFYPDALEETFEMVSYRPSMVCGKLVARGKKEKNGFIKSLEDIIDSEVIKLKTGGGDIHYGPKEQFDDATNTLAIAPGKVVTYRRNERTNQVLKESGVEVFPIDGYELIRGRGGPRCMTMPLVRG